MNINWLAGVVSHPLTSLTLHLQANVNTLIYKVHNSPEVNLSELPRGQGWGPWKRGR